MDAAELWVRHLPLAIHKKGKPYAARTIDTYRIEITQFAKWCGQRDVTDLADTTLLQHLASLRQVGHKESYIATRDKVVRLWLAWCRERGLITENPAAHIPRITVEDTPITVLTDRDIARLLAGCPVVGPQATWATVRASAIIHVLWRCGLRASELCNLEIEDYDAHKGHLAVRGLRERDTGGTLDPRSEARAGKKSESARRTVGVPDDARAALEDWLVRARGREPGKLFPGERGAAMTRDSLKIMLSRLGQRTGVAHVHPHRFRHTFAVNFLRAGGDLYILARLLGHSTLQMTTKYLRAIQAEDAAEEHVRLMRRR